MLTILLTDDEREEREGIQYLIEKFQMPLQVYQAANGRKALEQMRLNPADILFTDVKMPQMDGLELAREVSIQYPGTKIIIFSAYNEFSYAKQALEANAVNYLLKPIEIEEFRSVMEKVIADIETQKRELENQKQHSLLGRKNFLFRIFSTPLLNPSDQEMVKKLLFSPGMGICRLINIEFMSNFYETKETEFIKIAASYLGADSEYVNLYQNEAYLILHSSASFSKEALTEQLLKIVRDVNQLARDELSIIVGEKTGDLESFWEQLREINRIRQNAFLFGSQMLWTGIHPNSEYYALEIEAVKKQLLYAIDRNDDEAAGRYTILLTDTITQNHHISQIYIRNLLYSILYAVYEKNPGLKHENILQTAESLFQEKSARTLLDGFSDCIRQLLQCREQTDSDISSIVHKIKKLVDLEYQKEISLDYVAKQVNLAPTYVSWIFKKETGQNLIRYITDIKMEKARSLLAEGKLKIIQVGRACGYENQSYFNRLFKNYFGLTPKQYKENSRGSMLHFADMRTDGSTHD